MKNQYFLRIGNDYLEDAKPYPSRKEAIAAYLEAAQELDRYGQALGASIHIAPDANAVVEYPDLILSLTASGRARVETT